MKTKKVTKYVATDDKEFDTRIECQKHDLALHIEKALMVQFEHPQAADHFRPETLIVHVAEFIADRYNIKFP